MYKMGCKYKLKEKSLRIEKQKVNAIKHSLLISNRVIYGGLLSRNYQSF